MSQAVETDAELEKALATNSGADSYVRSVCISPDSSMLIAGTEDKTIKIWDLFTRRLRHSLKGHTKDIYSVDCCADGRFIASGSGDRTAKLWDVQTGACVRTFGNEEGPKDGVTSVAVSPDGKYLAAGDFALCSPLGWSLHVDGPLNGVRLCVPAGLRLGCTKQGGRHFLKGQQIPRGGKKIIKCAHGLWLLGCVQAPSIRLCGCGIARQGN